MGEAPSGTLGDDLRKSLETGRSSWGLQGKLTTGELLQAEREELGLSFPLRPPPPTVAGWGGWGGLDAPGGGGVPGSGPAGAVQ